MCIRDRACIYGVGMVCGYLYNRLMVVVAQGVLKNVRDDMFAHMQTLPIRYFDTHSLVSYTHLDVYKRQCWRWWTASPRC